MTIRKVADIIIRASPNGRLNVTGSGIKFYSYDKNSAAIDFHIQNQDRTPTDLFNVDVKLMLLTKENNEWKQFTAFDGVEIISGLDGHARYVIPDELRGYQGIVEGYVYLDFNDDSRSDECYFNFTIERSRIEEEFEHAGEYYIKEIQDTLDETIAELKKYAAEKVKEYEAQLSSLNSKISNAKNLIDSLATQTTSIQAKQAEILKLIADNNVATKEDLEKAKQESSANVIYQLIGKEEAEILITADFKEKITGSVVENPNIIRFSTNSTFMAPLTGSEPGQVYYDRAMTKDGVTLNVGNTNSDYMSQIQPNWNLVEIVDRTIPELFETVGLTDDSEKIEFIKNSVSYIKNTVDGVGTGLRRNRLTFKTYDSAGVLETEESVNDTAKIQELVREYADRATIKNMISDRGFFSALLFTEASDGVAVSQASLDYTKLEFKIKVSANLLIKLMIAANHVENLATQDEAESGTDNKKTMTPLRVFQAIAKWTKEKFVNKTGDETIAGAKNFTSTPLVNSVAVAKSDNVLNLIDPQTALGLKNFKNGIQLNGLNIASEYAKAVDTDKYNQKGAVYLGGNVWIAWETLTFQNTSGYSKGSYIRVGSDNNAAFTYPDVKNTTGGYIWLGGACQPDYTDGGFGSYHITIENNFDDARKPIVRFVDSPTTPVKKLAVRGVALIFAPPPTENSKI